MSLLLHLDRQKPQPLYRQIVQEIGRLIDAGTLKPRDQLPSSRKLAEVLGVDRSTVLTAYEELSALGYTRSRQGGYTTVAPRRTANRGSLKDKGALDWRRLLGAWMGEVQTGSDTQTDQIQSAIRFDLSSIEPDPRLYPMTEFRQCLRAVLKEAGSEALRYCDSQGYAPLRDSLARRLRLHGISVTEQEILITNGAQQALDLLMRILSGTGRSVAVELPTYGSVLPLLAINGLRPVGIPMNREGMDLEALDGVLIREKPVCIYTMPSFQNPTGLTTSHRHRGGLLDLAARHGLPIVEDGFEDDMKYEGPVPLPIKSMDTRGQVIYVGTFSKALFPGLRLGWLAADKGVIGSLASLKHHTDLSTQTLGQMVMERFCRLGCYDHHLQRLHRVFRKRMQLALQLAQDHFPDSVTWSRPVGGYVIWVNLPLSLEPEELNHQAAMLELKVSPGGAYFPGGGASDHVRLSIARLDERELPEAFLRLGQMLKKWK